MASYGRGSFGGFSQEENGTSHNASPDQVITTNIQTISHHILQLQQLVDQIGTKLDSEDLRTRIKDLQAQTNDCVKKTHQAINNLSDTPPENEDSTKWKVKRRLLSENFHDVLKTYQALQNRTKERMRATIRKSLTKSVEITIQTEMEESGTASHTSAQLDIIQEEVDVKIVKAREQEILELERDIVGLADIFKDLHDLVVDQGDQIDHIEKNVEETAVHVEEGKKDLEIAVQEVNSARKKTCFIILIVGSVVAVVVVLIVLGAFEII